MGCGGGPSVHVFWGHRANARAEPVYTQNFRVHPPLLGASHLSLNVHVPYTRILFEMMSVLQFLSRRMSGMGF